jgi:Mrp family chromosome partitioning ATPase
MSKLLAALQQIDGRPALTLETPASGVERPAPIVVGSNDSNDALQRLAELQRLLEQALAGQQTEAPDKPADGSIAPPKAPAVVEPTSRSRPADEPNQPVGVAREFAELADRLLAELNSAAPAVVSVFGIGNESADSFWLLPLAVALWQKHAGRILIVEADGDTPRWPAHLGIEAEIGLVELLESRVAWRDCLRSTAIPDLDLLPRGTGPIPAAGEPLSLLKLLLDNVKSEYALTLIAAGSADRPLAKHLAEQSEGVVLVVDLNATPQSAALRAKRLLDSTNARVLGAIVRG